MQKCIELEIPCSENYSLQRILGDPVEVVPLIKITVNYHIKLAKRLEFKGSAF